MLFIVSAANLVVGTFIGIAGIAGFLLPIIFTGVLKMDLSLSLSLSFLSFLTSGVIGAYRYHKAGQMDLRFGILVSIGSIIGAVIGVKLNFMIPVSTAKLLLYLVVLLSGCSILLKKEKEGIEEERSPLLQNKVFVLLFGLITGAICSLSGAGGPVLVMPILVSFGMSVRTAVGVSLFDSIFIALPACVGYMSKCSLEEIAALAIVSVIFQAIGVLIGTKIVNWIKVLWLKRGVAVFSIGISCYMIAGLIL